MFEHNTSSSFAKAVVEAALLTIASTDPKEWDVKRDARTYESARDLLGPEPRLVVTLYPNLSLKFGGKTGHYACEVVDLATNQSLVVDAAATQLLLQAVQGPLSGLERERAAQAEQQLQKELKQRSAAQALLDEVLTLLPDPQALIMRLGHLRVARSETGCYQIRSDTGVTVTLTELQPPPILGVQPPATLKAESAVVLGAALARAEVEGARLSALLEWAKIETRPVPTCADLLRMAAKPRSIKLTCSSLSSPPTEEIEAQLGSPEDACSVSIQRNAAYVSRGLFKLWVSTDPYGSMRTRKGLNLISDDRINDFLDVLSEASPALANLLNSYPKLIREMREKVRSFIQQHGESNWQMFADSEPGKPIFQAQVDGLAVSIRHGVTEKKQLFGSPRIEREISYLWKHGSFSCEIIERADSCATELYDKLLERGAGIAVTPQPIETEPSDPENLSDVFLSRNVPG
ncbi:MAG: hypothetical protein K1X83_09735 [Oligoflexia bacterium]|nr:hypothetical protein [Oligoflexia bacterium]